MNVLSLFDGLSGCRIALERIGVTPTKYYASEIDKYAIQVAQHNYPDTEQLGSVTEWESWGLDWASIDLVTGGFPCQAWSIAGKQMGDKDERGMLFWTMLDVMKMVLKHNPKAKFLIENVKMKKEFEEYITFHTQEALGHVNKILINSALVSAQNRNRWYWHNIEGVEQPEDKGLVLADVIERDFVDRDKSHCIDANYAKGGNLNSYFCKNRRQLVFLRPCEPREYSHWNGLTYRKLTPLECERLQTFPDGYTEGVSNTQRYKALGNAWTIDVIAHIFKNLNLNVVTLEKGLFIPSGTQLSLEFYQQINNVAVA
jgi:DNA (cytosine-5)-methyltransferase 1/DNA (cytosine-5)-methyltransferase 3A